MRQVDYSAVTARPQVRGSAGPLFSPTDQRTSGQADQRISLGPGGRIHGADGMLDQIAGAIAKHARPMLVADVIPAVQRDHAMQVRIGSAIGDAVAARYKPWIVLGVAALGTIAVVEILRWRSAKR